MICRCQCRSCGNPFQFDSNEFAKVSENNSVIFGQAIPCPHCSNFTSVYISKSALPKSSKTWIKITAAIVMAASAVIIVFAAVPLFLLRNVRSVSLQTNRIQTLYRYPPLTSAEESQAKNALAKMRHTHDEVRDIDWWSSGDGNLKNDFRLYIGQLQSGEAVLRLKVTYYGEDWIFMHSLAVKADDELFNIRFKGQAITDNSSSGVWEIYDELAGGDILMIEEATMSSNCIVRMEGKYNYDLRLTAEQKYQLSQTLLAYRYLGGNFPR